MFDAAARHLNFRVAAMELNVTQGAVAQSIRGLEADLGVSLFKRLPRGVALTEVGSRYHSGIARGLAAIDQATEDLRAGSRMITVSVPPSFASKWLVHRLPYFLEKNPGIEVHTVATEAVADFHTQAVDIAVRLGAKPTGDDLVVEALSPVELVIVCGPSVTILPSRNDGIEWFADKPLVQDSHKYWRVLLGDRWESSHTRSVSFNQTALAIDAAIAGKGYAVVPRFIAQGDLASGNLIEVRSVEREAADGFWAVHVDNRPPDAGPRSLFFEWLLEEVGVSRAKI